VNVRIRAIETEGSQMLREYLRLSIFVRPGDPPAADVVSRQEIARYVDGWGRPGDDAVAAIDAASGADLGAAWLRLWTPPDVGYGFVDAATPELGLAVRPQHRGRGIGTAMLHALLARAADRHPAASLSVSAEQSGSAALRAARLPRGRRRRRLADDGEAAPLTGRIPRPGAMREITLQEL
jgi:GNAT superfamily N-acetyltransferase